MGQLISMRDFLEDKRQKSLNQKTARTTNYLRAICQGIEDEIIREFFVPDELGEGYVDDGDETSISKRHRW